jgi:cephalosporin-C deacetylase-like acetyl esterase
VNFASRTKAQAFITVGFIDIACPPTGVYAIYNQFAGRNSLLAKNKLESPRHRPHQQTRAIGSAGPGEWFNVEQIRVL